MRQVNTMLERIQVKRKIVLLGDAAVGKTSLIKRYVLDVFSDGYLTTLGTKITSKKLLFKDEQNAREIELTLMIWDIMGQKDYKLIHETAYQGAKGALIVCDLTREETQTSLATWTSSLFNVTQNVPIIFVGNKNDLIDQSQINISKLTEISNAYQATYYTTSAKTGNNVDHVFYNIGKLMLQAQGVAV